MSVSHRELDLLAVSQGFETISLDGAEVNENVWAVFRFTPDLVCYWCAARKWARQIWPAMSRLFWPIAIF